MEGAGAFRTLTFERKQAWGFSPGKNSSTGHELLHVKAYG